MKITISILLILISQIGNAQSIPIKQWHVTKIHRDSIYENVHICIDTIIGDTAKHFIKLGKYVELSKEGRLLVDGYKLGGMGTVCGCEPIPHDYWIERYRNGNLKQQGRYFCNRKIGVWTSYYKNGKIKKIENHERTYMEIFTKQGMPGKLKKGFLLEGPYLEYYPNGQMKVEGRFEIVEEFTTIDTIFTYDSETYEPIATVVEGEFWIPKSKKSGYWNSYSENGELTSHQYFKLTTWKDNNIRNIEARYWDIIQELINSNKEEKK